MLKSDRLYRPLTIPSIGTFQDGGLKYNNPVNLALWESSLICPAVGKPDLVVSLGTGIHQAALSSSALSPCRFKDGFVPRIWRSFMFSLDGQGPWKELLNGLGKRERQNYMRLNVPIHDNGDLCNTNRISEY